MYTTSLRRSQLVREQFANGSRERRRSEFFSQRWHSSGSVRKRLQTDSRFANRSRTVLFAALLAATAGSLDPAWWKGRHPTSLGIPVGRWRGKQGAPRRIAFASSIVSRVRMLQPQVVMSGEGYGSWDELLAANADLGGQGNTHFHDAMQQAVRDGDATSALPNSS